MTLNEILQRKENVSDETCNALRNVCLPFEIEKGEILAKQGEVCNNIYFISKGLFRLIHEKDSKEDTVVFGGAGEVFLSFQGYKNREPSLYSLHCLESAGGWYTSIDKFKMLIKKYPDLMAWWVNVLASQIYTFENLYSLFSLVDAEQRIENFWSICNPELQSNNYRKTFNQIPMKYFAQYIGITPQSLSRLRRKIMNTRLFANREDSDSENQ